VERRRARRAAEVAEKMHADVVIVGAHGLGAARAVLGSVSDDSRQRCLLAPSKLSTMLIGDASLFAYPRSPQRECLHVGGQLDETTSCQVLRMVRRPATPCGPRPGPRRTTVLCVSR
jgi:hypothetical protein